MIGPPGACPVCGGAELELVFRWDEPPARETRFALAAGQPYQREFWRCTACGHLTGATTLDLDALYAGEYIDDAYGDGGLEAAFDRVMGLPADESDNAGRAQRVDAFCAERGLERRLLDIGSGLGVFPAAMVARGWEVTALDPDARASEHIARRVACETVAADLREYETSRRFPLVTLNKVLEHLADPAAALERAAALAAPGGLLYVELPDGEAAAAAGPDREELFIEHLHAFSPRSLELLAERAGLETLKLERIHEPSDKLTLFAFLGGGAQASH